MGSRLPRPGVGAHMKEAVRPRVVHLTSVHPPLDTRIFAKEAKTLAKSGFAVTLLAPHTERAAMDGVDFVRLRRPDHRLGRMVFGTIRATRQARQLNASIYHLHDPELV